MSYAGPESTSTKGGAAMSYNMPLFENEEVERLKQRICELQALVESAYQEGFIDGYDDDARPQDADAGWEHSDVRKQLEPPR